MKQQYKKNRDYILNRAKKYASTHKSKISTYREKNKEKLKDLGRKWAEKNPHKVSFASSKRRSAKLNRTPSWLTKDDLKQIAEIYKEANRLTKETNISHHVDHIVPLQGRNVSGLHVPANLQILTATDNIRKSNKY
jgi:5-methylcytosine-specific restriction endonuclease McrA